MGIDFRFVLFKKKFQCNPSQINLSVHRNNEQYLKIRWWKIWSFMIMWIIHVFLISCLVQRWVLKYFYYPKYLEYMQYVYPPYYVIVGYWCIGFACDPVKQFSCISFFLVGPMFISNQSYYVNFPPLVEDFFCPPL